MAELFANSGDSDQTPRSAASDLGFHYLPVTRLWVYVFNGLILLSVDLSRKIMDD